MLRLHGLKSGYDHKLLGINNRFDPIQAALLSLELRYLDSWNIQRQKEEQEQVVYSLKDCLLSEIKRLKKLLNRKHDFYTRAK